MTDDIDIYRAANEHLKRYDKDTTVQACMKVGEVLEKGSMEGRSMWLRVIRAIEDLEFKGRPKEAKIH